MKQASMILKIAVKMVDRSDLMKLDALLDDKQNIYT